MRATRVLIALTIMLIVGYVCAPRAAAARDPDARRVAFAASPDDFGKDVTESELSGPGGSAALSPAAIVHAPRD